MRVAIHNAAVLKFSLVECLAAAAATITSSCCSGATTTTSSVSLSFRLMTCAKGFFRGYSHVISLCVYHVKRRMIIIMTELLLLQPVLQLVKVAGKARK